MMGARYCDASNDTLTHSPGSASDSSSVVSCGNRVRQAKPQAVSNRRTTCFQAVEALQYLAALILRNLIENALRHSARGARS
jgi:hypothetical protein